MSPAIDPMTFEELSELYRVEMKGNSLTTVRRDLFRAMANLLTSLRQDYDKHMSIDPDSVMAEGADQRRKKGNQLCKQIVEVRARKIAIMAVRGASGSVNDLSCLTEEEREYYQAMHDLTKRQLSEVDRLRGKKVTVDTHIDEIPPKVPVDVLEPEPIPPVIAPMPPDMPQDDGFDDIPDPEDMFAEEQFDEPFQPVDTTPVVIEAPVPNVEGDVGSETGPDVTPDAEPVMDECAVDERIGSDSELEPILIRVLEDLPEFAGPDRDYKLSKEDVVTMPRVLADVLINTEKAIAIRPTP